MATSGPRLFHIFKLVILDKRELRLSDGSGKFQERFGLASSEPISVFKGWIILIGQPWVMCTLLNQSLWLRRWSALIGQVWVMCSSMEPEALLVPYNPQGWDWISIEWWTVSLKGMTNMSFAQNIYFFLDWKIAINNGESVFSADSKLKLNSPALFPERQCESILNTQTQFRHMDSNEKVRYILNK